jgi:phage tail-like protein
MPINNLNYLYEHLPPHYRVADENLFLKRFLQFFGTTLDEFDEKFENFHLNIQPSTASEVWVEFWLSALFGWSWFPKWFQLADKRRLYGNFAKHLAARGTAKGIEAWLADFDITATVHKSPVFYGEYPYGEPQLYVDGPLLLIIKILQIKPVNYAVDGNFGESAYGEFAYAENVPLLSRSEIENLLRYVQPHGQEFVVGNISGE